MPSTAMTSADLLRFAKHLDERDISDAANHFADDAHTIMTLPTNAAEWRASLAVAFEAGRKCESSGVAAARMADAKARFDTFAAEVDGRMREMRGFCR